MLSHRENSESDCIEEGEESMLGVFSTKKKVRFEE